MENSHVLNLHVDYVDNIDEKLTPNPFLTRTQYDNGVLFTFEAKLYCIIMYTSNDDEMCDVVMSHDCYHNLGYMDSNMIEIIDESPEVLPIIEGGRK